MFNEEDDKQRIKRITIIEGTTDDQFLQECFALGTVASGLAQIEEAINSCECEGVDLTDMKKQFPMDYKRMVKSMKRGELEKVYDEIKAYMVAYKAAHLLVLDENDDDKLASVLNGPLCGVPSKEQILH